MKKKIFLRRKNNINGTNDSILKENMQLAYNLKRMTVLHELDKQIKFTDSIPSILNRILLIVSKVFCLDSALVLLNTDKPNRFFITSEIGFGESVLDNVVNLPDEIILELKSNRQSCTILKDDINPSYSSFFSRLYSPDIEVLPNVVIPIFLKDRLYAIMFLAYSADFSSEDLEILDSSKIIATNILDNAENFQSLQITKSELDRKYLELSTVYGISRKLNGTLELEAILNTTLDTIMGIVGAKEGILFLLDDARRLIPKTYFGISKDVIGKLKVNLRESIVKKIVEYNYPFIVNEMVKDLRWYEFYHEFHQKVQGNQLWLPLVVKRVLVGIISLSEKIDNSVYTKGDFKLLSTIGSQAAMTIKNADLFREMHSLFVNSVVALSKAIDARDPYTSGHSERVTEIAVAIATKMGLPRDEIELIRFAGTLHDIGKIGVTEEILKKPGKLSEAEYAHICLHPLIGANIILPIAALQQVVPIVLYHHERYDAKGYPEHLGKDEIPIGARIIAVADTYDAMTSNRPYRQALPKEVAIAEIKRCSGTQFDPMVVQYFLELFEPQNKIVRNIIS